MYFFLFDLIVDWLWVPVCVVWCAETSIGFCSLWEGALPSGSGRDRLLWPSVFRHFKHQCESFTDSVPQIIR